MIKILFLIFCLLSLNAQDSLTAQKQNTLYVQNLIETEENIAKMFEKYILTEFAIPTLDKLSTNSYLGSNFSTTNKMGTNIAFENTSTLRIKYAITKDEYRAERINGNQNFLVLFYNRELHRNYTSAFDDSTDLAKSYIQISLKSKEAQTLFAILNTGNTIAKECANNLTNTYCNKNKKTIRWYTDSSQWIEYDKIDFNNGNVTISSSGLLSNSKLNDLAVGSYIFVENSTRYVKLTNNADGSLQILKVD
ncbi:hypothetical protein KKG81_11995 [bacterium]|nr:hypothetical protein [bacterium]